MLFTYGFPLVAAETQRLEILERVGSPSTRGKAVIDRESFGGSAPKAAPISFEYPPLLSRADPGPVLVREAHRVRAERRSVRRHGDAFGCANGRGARNDRTRVGKRGHDRFF
jgi:hypothetical protein